MATGVVGKGAADEHGIQKLAATADFGQRRVVLQGVRIHGHGAIEYLARRENAVRPARQLIRFILEQLESVLIVLGGRSYFRLPETGHDPPPFVLSPIVADSQSVSDHCPDSSPHLPHFRQLGDRRGCKAARKPWWRLSGRGVGSRSAGVSGAGIGGRGIGGSGAGRSAGVRDRYCQYDAMALNGDDAVSNLGQSFNIDVGAAIDLPDCRSGALPVHDEDFIFSRCALREEDSRERQDKSQRQEESKIAMFVHHARFTSISALTCEATDIIRRRAFYRGAGSGSLLTPRVERASMGSGVVCQG